MDERKSPDYFQQYVDEMRLQDFLDRLTDDDREEFFATIEAEEKTLRSFLSKFDEDVLIEIGEFMNDAFQMPADDLNETEFIVTLYKCQKADFFYEDVQELLEDIRNFVLEPEE